MQTILEQPYGLGRILLGAVTIGLFDFVLWCCIQALFDTEGKGTTAKGLIARIGYAAVGIMDAALAYGAFQLVTGSGSLTNCREHERTVSKQSYQTLL